MQGSKLTFEPTPLQKNNEKKCIHIVCDIARLSSSGIYKKDTYNLSVFVWPQEYEQYC